MGTQTGLNGPDKQEFWGGGLPAAFLACACSISMWCFSRGVFGQLSGHRLLCIIIMCAPAHVLVVLLGSAIGVLALVCFLVFPLPTQGSRCLSLIVCISIELTVQCDRCLIWGLVWWAGLVAGLRVGQASWVFHRPGFGLLVPVARSLSTQPPFATQALMRDRQGAALKLQKRQTKQGSAQTSRTSNCKNGN